MDRLATQWLKRPSASRCPNRGSISASLAVSISESKRLLKSDDVARRIASHLLSDLKQCTSTIATNPRSVAGREVGRAPTWVDRQHLPFGQQRLRAGLRRIQGPMIKTRSPWGLTEEDAATKPWNLEPWLLEPGKRITDAVHGTIYLNKLEVALVNSPAMQRLRRVRQLGTTHLVYPSATHTRFSHALGALHVAQQLMNCLVAHLEEPGRVKYHLLDEWRAEGLDEYRAKWAEATVLARLGGLLHDFTHVPYGHTLEDDLGLAASHDSNGARYAGQMKLLDPRSELLTDPLRQELRRIILKKTEGEDLDDYIGKSAYPFVHDVVGNTVCADLLDYLWRDHHAAGLSIGLGDRFLSSLFITRSKPDEQHYPERVAVSLVRHNIRRSDVESDLLKCLRYRYELDERVLTHHAKLTADAMIGKLFWMYKAELRKRARRKLAAERHDAGDEAFFASYRGHLEAADDAEIGPFDFVVEGEVNDAVEGLLLTRGDDGVLESLVADDSMPKEISDMARALLDRRLYLRIGHLTEDVRKERIHRRFKTAQQRHDLEARVADKVGAKPHQVAVWIPKPSMRFKLALVLVSGDEGTEIATLEQRLGSRDDARVIYEQHKELWRVSAYADPELPPAIRARLRDELAKEIGISWDEDEEEVQGDPGSRRGEPALLRVAAFDEDADPHAVTRDLGAEGEEGEEPINPDGDDG